MKNKKIFTESDGYLLSREEFYNVLAKRHGQKMQKALEGAKVAVFGLGGLGSNIVNILARSGVGEIYALDFDTVDVSNLHRQLYRINQIGMKKATAIKEVIREANPFCELFTYDMKFSPQNEQSLQLASELCASADVVCEAFDDPTSKADLVNFVLEKFPDKRIVCASGMAGIDSANLIKTTKKAENLYLCGDEVSEVGDGREIFCSRVTVCAAHQAHTIVRLIADLSEV